MQQERASGGSIGCSHQSPAQNHSTVLKSEACTGTASREQAEAKPSRVEWDFVPAYQKAAAEQLPGDSAQPRALWVQPQH